MAHRRIVRRSTPSLKTWSGIQNVVNDGPVTAAINISATAGPGVQTIATSGSLPTDETVLRTRGAWDVSYNVEEGESLTFAFGMAIITEEAGSAGAVPNVLTNMDWDGWYLHQIRTIQGSDNSATPSGITVMQDRDFDSKAMRKIQAGNIIVIAMQTFSNTPIVQTGTGRITISGRILLKTS